MSESQMLDEPQLRAAMKMSRDVRAAAATMGPEEARMLVSMYYNWQQERIRAQGRIRSALEDDSPHETIAHFLGVFEVLERQAKGALERFALGSPEGEWAMSITGIGPVLAAGLMAHIDIDRSPYAGSLMTFAGLNPNRKWIGAEGSRALIKSAFAIEGVTEAGAVYHIAQQANRRMSELYKAMHGEDYVELPPERYLEVLNALAGHDVSSLWLQCQIENSAYIDNSFNLALERLEIKPGLGYRQLYDGVKVVKTALTKYLARRPWNADLKVLAWKIGESFVKVQSRESDVYGKMFAAAKEKYNAANDRGEYADAAEEKLDTTNIGKETIAYSWYSEGKLPPAHVNERAKRIAVKMFLSHYWEVLYTIKYGREAPPPYVIQHMGHDHNRYIPPPNFDKSRWLR